MGQSSMISPTELQAIPIFACLDEADRQRFAERAADVRMQPEAWLIRERGATGFFVLLEGEVHLVKDILGRPKELRDYKAGDFFGELPILLGAPSLASCQAVSKSRVARFEAQHLLELIQGSAACSALILQTMTDRLKAVILFVLG